MSGNINFNGWINDDGSENYKCRAWVNFDGSGTVAIRNSGNVSSITDNGSSDYTVNFTVAMPDENYVLLCTSTIAGSPNGNYVYGVRTTTASAAGPIDLKSTTQVRIQGASGSGTEVDNLDINVAIFR